MKKKKTFGTILITGHSDLSLIFFLGDRVSAEKPKS
jgi:hypothetical protein